GGPLGDTGRASRRIYSAGAGPGKCLLPFTPLRRGSPHPRPPSSLTATSGSSSGMWSPYLMPAAVITPAAGGVFQYRGPLWVARRLVVLRPAGRVGQVIEINLNQFAAPAQIPHAEAITGRTNLALPRRQIQDKRLAIERQRAAAHTAIG